MVLQAYTHFYFSSFINAKTIKLKSAEKNICGGDKTFDIMKYPSWITCNALRLKISVDYIIVQRRYIHHYLDISVYNKCSFDIR